MFKFFSMSHIEGDSRLSDTQKNLFDITYKSIYHSMDEDIRLNYTENFVKEIVGKTSTLKVYFDNGHSTFI